MEATLAPHDWHQVRAPRLGPPPFLISSCSIAYYSKKTDATPKGWFSLRDVTEMTVAREAMEKHPNVLVISQTGLDRQVLHCVAHRVGCGLTSTFLVLYLF